MKLPNPLLPFAAVLALTIPAVAQDAPTPAAQERGPQPNRVELIRQFDKNGDGILDETERQAAREAALQGRPQRPAAQNAERSAAAQEFMRRLDKNGDGKIDEAERAAARAELAKRTQLTTGSNLTAATAGRPAIDQRQRARSRNAGDAQPAPLDRPTNATQRQPRGCAQALRHERRRPNR
jgi:hypothetical protein